MKFCKMFILVTSVVLLLAGSSLGQITIPSSAIPTQPGQVMRYHVFADTTEGIDINIGEEAGNQLWDFNEFVNETEVKDSLFHPMSGPMGILFPNADRGIYTYGVMGLDVGQVYRYEGIEDTAWTVQGFIMDVVFDTLTGIPITVPIPFPEPIKMAELPMTFGNEITLDDSIHYYYTPSDTVDLEVLIVLEYGGYNEIDAWGTLQYPGGEAECLRMHAGLGGVVNVYPVFLGVPLPIPIFTRELDLTNSYTWYAPDLGELATVITMPDTTGELEIPVFARIRTTQTNSTPEQGISVPSAFTLNPAYPNPFNASTRFSFTLPEAQKIDVAVFDVMGRFVQTLAGGYQNAGEHSIGWNAGNQPSGTYFIRVSSAEGTLSQKVVLVK